MRTPWHDYQCPAAIADQLLSVAVVPKVTAVRQQRNIVACTVTWRWQCCAGYPLSPFSAFCRLAVWLRNRQRVSFAAPMRSLPNTRAQIRVALVSPTIVGPVSGPQTRKSTARCRVSHVSAKHGVALSTHGKAGAIGAHAQNEGGGALSTNRQVQQSKIMAFCDRTAGNWC